MITVSLLGGMHLPFQLCGSFVGSLSNAIHQTVDCARIG
jgi:hypothetical protein